SGVRASAARHGVRRCPLQRCFHEGEKLMRPRARFVCMLAVGLAWACASTLSSQTPRTVRYVSQDWTQEDRNLFYTTTQGSQLVPYSWYLALERPGSGTDRFNLNHLARYGYLENPNLQFNPDRLPLGFVKDGEEDWLGLTCAACHTNEIESRGMVWRV